MDEKEARETIKGLKHFDELLFDKRFDDPERSTMREYITAKGFLAGLEAGLQKADDLLLDKLNDERNNGDTERGHLQSMHIGAMDALGEFRETLKEVLAAFRELKQDQSTDTK